MISLDIISTCIFLSVIENWQQIKGLQFLGSDIRVNVMDLHINPKLQLFVFKKLKQIVYPILYFTCMLKMPGS